MAAGSPAVKLPTTGVPVKKTVKEYHSETMKILGKRNDLHDMLEKHKLAGFHEREAVWSGILFL